MLEGGSTGNGLCWEAIAAVPAHLLCCTWPWSRAGARVCPRERIHPAEPGPARAHPDLMVLAWNRECGVWNEQHAHGGVWCHQPARLVPALWKGWVGMGLEAMLWGWKPRWLMGLDEAPSQAVSPLPSPSL